MAPETPTVEPFFDSDEPATPTPFVELATPTTPVAGPLPVTRARKAGPFLDCTEVVPVAVVLVPARRN